MSIGWRNIRADQRAYRKERGLCVDCGEPAIEGKTLCELHRRKAQESKAAWKQRQKNLDEEAVKAKVESERKKRDLDERMAESERTNSLIPLVRRKPPDDYGPLGDW